MMRIEDECLDCDSDSSFLKELLCVCNAMLIDMRVDLEKDRIFLTIFEFKEISWRESLDIFYECGRIRFCFVGPFCILEEGIMIRKSHISFFPFFVVDFCDGTECRIRPRRFCRARLSEARLYPLCEVGSKCRITPVKFSPIYRTHGDMNFFRKECIVHKVSFFVSLERVVHLPEYILEYPIYGTIFDEREVSCFLEIEGHAEMLEYFYFRISIEIFTLLE